MEQSDRTKVRLVQELAAAKRRAERRLGHPISKANWAAACRSAARVQAAEDSVKAEDILL